MRSLPIPFISLSSLFAGPPAVLSARGRRASRAIGHDPTSSARDTLPVEVTFAEVILAWVTRARTAVSVSIYVKVITRYGRDGWLRGGGGRRRRCNSGDDLDQRGGRRLHSLQDGRSGHDGGALPVDHGDRVHESQEGRLVHAGPVLADLLDRGAVRFLCRGRAAGACGRRRAGGARLSGCG